MPANRPYVIGLTGGIGCGKSTVSAYIAACGYEIIDADAMSRRHEIYNETLEYILEKEKNGDLFVIRPPEPLAVGKIEHSVAKMQEAYITGRKTMESQLDALKAYLAE